MASAGFRTRVCPQRRAQQGRSERAVPLLVAQEVLQLPAEQILVFHRDRPPARGQRADWRTVGGLRARHGLPLPAVPSLPPAPGLPDLEDAHQPTNAAPPPPPTSRPGRERANGQQPELDLFEKW